MWTTYFIGHMYFVVDENEFFLQRHLPSRDDGPLQRRQLDVQTFLRLRHLPHASQELLVHPQHGPHLRHPHPRLSHQVAHLV